MPGWRCARHRPSAARGRRVRGSPRARAPLHGVGKTVTEGDRLPKRRATTRLRRVAEAVHGEGARLARASFPPTASKPMTWFCAFTFGSSSCVVSRRSAPSSPHDVPPEMARSFDWHSLRTRRVPHSVDVRVGHADGLRPHGHRADHAGRTCGARGTGRPAGPADPAAPPALPEAGRTRSRTEAVSDSRPSRS